MPIPALISAGASIGSAYLSRDKQSKGQKAAEGAQIGAMNAQSALARQTSEFARRQYTLAEPAYAKALQYYTNLSGAGGQNALNEALIPQYRQIGELYSGAKAGITGSMRGATRDVAMAKLSQQQVGQMADTASTGRTGAMQQLANMGTSGVGASGSMMSSASGMYGNAAGTAGNLYQQALERQRLSEERGSGMGASLFKLFMPWLQQKYGGAGNMKVPTQSVGSWSPSQLGLPNYSS